MDKKKIGKGCRKSYIIRIYRKRKGELWKKNLI